MSDPNRLRQCATRRDDGLRCEGQVTAYTTHVDDHWATLPNGNTVRWCESPDFQQCRATHGQTGTRCPQYADHVGDHWAMMPDGTQMHWTDLACGPPVPLEGSGARDRQVGGEHYLRAIQVWDIIDVWELDYYRGLALKYLLRAGTKGAAVEDLKKARHVLDRAIEKAEAGDGR